MTIYVRINFKNRFFVYQWHLTPNTKNARTSNAWTIFTKRFLLLLQPYLYIHEIQRTSFLTWLTQVGKPASFCGETIDGTAIESGPDSISSEPPGLVAVGVGIAGVTAPVSMDSVSSCSVSSATRKQRRRRVPLRLLRWTLAWGQVST